RARDEPVQLGSDQRGAIRPPYGAEHLARQSVAHHADRGRNILRRQRRDAAAPDIESARFRIEHRGELAGIHEHFSLALPARNRSHLIGPLAFFSVRIRRRVASYVSPRRSAISRMVTYSPSMRYVSAGLPRPPRGNT